MKQFLKCLGLCALFLSGSVHAAVFPETNIKVEFTSKALVLHGELIHGVESFKVFVGDSPHALFGVVKPQLKGLVFEPAAPFLQGRTYRVEVEKADSTWEKLEFKLHLLGTKWEIGASPSLIVRIAPSPTVLPANALKLYLQFSHPMEQGVFLERITLHRDDGSIVNGAFRETELWSPDGTRLTLWLHPGRQKTGVNLNTDEGPVLQENKPHTLRIAATWRSAEGVALGKEFVFPLTVGAIDHACPDPQHWKISAPKAGTRNPLMITFDEPLDPAMLVSALKVKRGEGEVEGVVTVAADARAWSFTPAAGWERGTLTLQIDPLLEDLAGNNLLGPFEVDREAPAKAAKTSTLGFEVGG